MVEARRYAAAAEGFNVAGVVAAATASILTLSGTATAVWTEDSGCRQLSTIESESFDGDTEMTAMSTPWSWFDMVERGRVSVANGDLRGACGAFEIARQAAPGATERVAATCYLANALMISVQAEVALSEAGVRVIHEKQVRRAGRLLNEAQQLCPGSRDVALGRVKAWSMAGDALETLAAEHQLRVIDPALEGAARCNLGKAAKIVLVICNAGTIILKSIEFEGALDTTQRAMLLNYLDTAAQAAQLAIDFSDHRRKVK